MSKTGNPETVVQASDIRKQFGNHEALTGIDLTVKKGEIVLVMGPNGAGKSVFMSCLAGSTNPSSGQIRFFENFSPKEARPAVSTMFQGSMTDPELTGRENLAFYEALHPQGTNRWQELATRLEIEEDLDRVVGDYSGGMKRKIEIAITLTLMYRFIFSMSRPSSWISRRFGSCTICCWECERVGRRF